MIGTVRAKAVLVVVGVMVLIQSGPVPACLLDEAAAACLSMSSVPVPERQPIVRAPKGNDTPDEVSRGWSQQQSFGSDGNVAALAHVLTSAVAAPSQGDLAGGICTFATLRLDARSTSPPFDRLARRFTLLT